MEFQKIWIICRVCLKQQNEMYNIFENIHLKNISSILRDCGGVPVQRNDGFPDKICDICLKSLWRANIFRKDCQRAHREFLQILLDNSSELYDLELSKTIKVNCSETLQIADTIKTSCKDSSSNSSTVTSKESQSISIHTKHSTNINTDLAVSQTSLQESNTILSGNDKTIEQTDIVKNKYDSTIPHAINDTSNSVVKQYCVVTKHNSNEQFVGPKQENIKEPIVLLLKLKNNNNNNNNNNKTVTRNKPTQIKNTTENKISKKSTEMKSNNKILSKNKSFLKKNIISKLKKDLQKSNIDRKTNLEEKIRCDKNQKSKNGVTCKMCNKHFKTNADLRHHMYTHNKPYQCSICNKKFSQSHSFISHRNNHIGTKPFNCRMCDKKFADISNRNSHERDCHTQAEFKCMDCSKVFRFPSMLKKHSLSHVQKKCFICGKEFSSLQVVRLHHQRVHLKSLSLYSKI